jgi:hypothetical protein
VERPIDVAYVKALLVSSQQVISDVFTGKACRFSPRHFGGQCSPRYKPQLPWCSSVCPSDVQKIHLAEQEERRHPPGLALAKYASCAKSHVPCPLLSCSCQCQLPASLSSNSTYGWPNATVEGLSLGPQSCGLILLLMRGLPHRGPG